MWVRGLTVKASCLYCRVVVGPNLDWDYADEIPNRVETAAWIFSHQMSLIETGGVLQKTHPIVLHDPHQAKLAYCSLCWLFRIKKDKARHRSQANNSGLHLGATASIIRKQRVLILSA